MGQTEAAQRGGECNSHSGGSKGDLTPKPLEDRVKFWEFGRFSRLNDVRGLRIQPSLRARRLKCTARMKRHRVPFQRSSRHFALPFKSGRTVINRWCVELIGVGVVIFQPRNFFLFCARDQIRSASELRMTAT